MNNEAAKYVYAIKEANLEERMQIFNSLGSSVKYDNPSHDGIPFYIKSFYGDPSRSQQLWLNRDGEIVTECPFVVVDGNYMEKPTLKK